MSEPHKHRPETWLTVVAVAVGLPVVAVVVLVGFFASVTPLHSDPHAVLSVMHAPPLPEWTDAVAQAQRVVRAGVAEQNVPGLSVAVGVNGDIVWAEGFGWASLESRVPVAPGMRFRIGHVSKALTSAAVGLLRQQGLLHLDDEIQVYVPAYPRKEWPVTLRQLMGHMAGVRHYRDTEWGDKPSMPCARASEGVRHFAEDPLLFKPETQYRYSTYGWVLVSAAVEAAANEPFSQFMRTRIFTPMGMPDTVSDSAIDPIPNRVTSYYRGNFKTEITTDVDYSCFAGAGAFLSTPSDLVRFGFAVTSGRFLQPATVSLLQARQALTSGEDTDYGLGWMIDTVELAGERTPLVFHASRTIEGASTSFLTFPERGLVVVVMANMSFADPRSIAMRVAETFAASRKSGV